MALTRVLLGHALFFLRSGFAERPAVSHISLQTDSIDGSTVEEMADLSQRMGVYSRAAFEALPSNGSSLIQKAEAGPPHTCTAANKVIPDTDIVDHAFEDALKTTGEDFRQMGLQLGFFQDGGATRVGAALGKALEENQRWLNEELPTELRPAASTKMKKLLEAGTHLATELGIPPKAGGLVMSKIFRDLASGECCTTTMITQRLVHLANYKPVMDMTNILAGCNCLCGSFGHWKGDVATRLSENGFTDLDYAKVTARDGHTCNAIEPGRDVEYEQLHVLADKQSDTEKLTQFIDQAVQFRDTSCTTNPNCAEKQMLDKAVEHFQKYQTAKHGSNATGANLGIWHDSSTCKVNELIGPITHWGSSDGVQHLVPRVGQPVMDYQLTKLIKEEKIEPGRIETCIEEHGFWKEGVSLECGVKKTANSHRLARVKFSEQKFGTAGIPEANEPVKPYQLLVLSKAGADMNCVNTKIRGKANANAGALAGGARALGEHIMRYQDYDSAVQDPYWERPTASGKGQCEGKKTPVQGKLSKAKETCLEDKSCCFLSATTVSATTWQRCDQKSDGGDEELFKIRRSTPDPSDIMTIEVAMNFQGKLDRHPLVWKAGVNLEEETERFELMSGFFQRPGKECPAPALNACQCGCATEANRCGDPFNGNRPKEGNLVTAEQAGIFYYYGVDITTDTNSSGPGLPSIAGGSKYVEPGVHWKWKSSGLTWLATKRFDLPGAEVGSSGPAEEENVTPYQLHFLLQQAPELKSNGDIMEWLASQGEKGYVMRGSPGLKPCDTKQHPEETRLTAELEKLKNDNDFETPLILSSRKNGDPKANDAPMGNDAEWTHRADDVDVHGRISGNVPNLDPHSGSKDGENRDQPHKIPKTHSYDELLKELQFTEKLRKEKEFAGEFPIYWEKGYRAWKLNQDVRQLENKYLKDLYITSNAASKIVKKEYDVDNRLTSNVTTIVENEKKHGKGEAGESDYWESALEPGASNSKLKYFTDWNHDSKMSQVHALHAYKDPAGRPLLTYKEIDKDLAAGGKFAGTVTTVGENEMQMMVNRRMTAMMAGQRVRFKLSPHVATILSNGVLREIQRSGSASTAAMADFPHPGGFIAEGSKELSLQKDSYGMAMAAFEYILDDPPYKVKKNQNQQIDCDFSKNMAILSKFNHYLDDTGAEVELVNIVDSEDPTYWQIRPILQWRKSPGHDIDSYVARLNLANRGSMPSWLEAAGAQPEAGDVVQPEQIFALLQHMEEANLSVDMLNELNPDLGKTLFQLPVGVDDSGAFTIRSVRVNKQTGNQTAITHATYGDGKEYTQDPRASDEDKVGHWLSWSGSISHDSASEGTVHYTKSAGFGPTEVWSIADDGSGGLAISAYQTKLFGDDPGVNAVKTNLLDENSKAILKGKGVRQPWMLLTKDGAPGCKVTVELKSPPRTDEKSENLEKKYERLLGAGRPDFKKFQEFLHSIQPQDLEEANGIKSQQGGGKIYLRPSARLLDYVHLDKTRATTGERAGSLTEEALNNLIAFFKGPWQILKHEHGGVEVALKEGATIAGKPYPAGEKLKEMKKKDGTALWSVSGLIRDSDLALVDITTFTSLGGVIENEMQPWKHAAPLQQVLGNSVATNTHTQ